MVTLDSVEDQLKNTGSDFRFWGRSEIKELTKVLTDDEKIHRCVNGHYLGGFAMLVATNRRLMLIDRKPMYLTIEAIWYDKIGQVDYSHRLLNATICISTPNKDLNFTSWNHASLREILMHTQEKMIEAKNKSEGIEEATPPNSSTTEVAPEPEPATEQLAAQNFPRWGQTADSESQPTPHRHPHLRFPVMPDELTLYTATRLPFNRRRRFAGSEY